MALFLLGTRKNRIPFVLHGFSGVARGGGQLPPGADLRGAPKCLDVCYK